MGVFKSSSTPQPEEEKEENLLGIANVDNSEMGGEHSSVNDYSVDLNFVSLHLNTLASSGALVFIVLISLTHQIFTTGGATRIFNRLMDLKCLLPCCCREPDPGLPEPSAPAIPTQQPLPDVELQQGPPGGPAGGPGGSQQDLQGPQGPSLSEVQDLQSALIQEIKSLKRSMWYCKRLEEVTMGAVRGLRDKVVDMRALCREELVESRGTMQFLRENFTSETRNGPQDSRVYPKAPRTTDMEDPRTNSMLRELFSSLVDPSIPREYIYKLDESSASCDSGKLY